MNLPNSLALFRIILAPILFGLYININNSSIFGDLHISWINYFITLLFVIASITDFLDGFIARSWNQTTLLGAVLDPIADKLLILACFMGLMIIDRANEWIVFLILAREFIITGIRVVAVGHGLDVSASIYGKMKTFVQIFAIGFLSMQWSGGEELLILALILTIYSGYEYIRDFSKQLKDKL
jgi:CDP-diacylglycerol--glycerol-3-phosphate 3-phosphatidyltransferase